MRDQQQIADALHWTQRQADTMPLTTMIEDRNAFEIVTATIEVLKWVLGESQGSTGVWLTDAAYSTASIRNALSKIKGTTQ